MRKCFLVAGSLEDHRRPLLTRTFLSTGTSGDFGFLPALPDKDPVFDAVPRLIPGAA